MSEVHKFLFEGLPVRGMVVRLTDAWREVLQRRQQGGDPWPQPVRTLMGEMAAAGALMQSNIKFDGALVLQIHGDGPVKLAVAEVQSDLAFRVTAQLDGPVADGDGIEAMLNVNGRGRCAITLDPKNRQPGQQPYQGVVPLYGDQREPLQRLSEVLEHYMLQSEQLDTKLVLAANDEVAAGLLIQRLPVEGVGNLGGERNEDQIGESEDFDRIAMLAATLSADELLSLDVDTLLRRLFWEENLRRFEPMRGELGPRFVCSCSRERVAQMLNSLGREEVESVVAERGEVEVGCEFCGIKYHFDAVDVGELFAPLAAQAPGSASIN
ncbi:Hsp33 family molecular chaperone HslO [Piscinibacter sakaiensis]|uniref:Hsp33 family molecular chaperone HslO n=1 Tax=Piscinibacter sakaiensis TaxID=1547922 RepID=UPI003AB00F0A